MNYPQPYGYPAPAQTQVLLQPYRCSTAHVVIAWVVTVLTGFYMLPWAIAATRNRRNVAAIAMIDVFLGWSVIGWVVALVMACGTDQPLVVVQHTYAPPPPQPQWQPQPWGQTPQALPAGPSQPTYHPAEPTMVDPLGTEPTQVFPRSPWEPDHRR